MFNNIRRAITVSLAIQLSVFCVVAFFFRLSAEVAAMGRTAGTGSVSSLTGGYEGAMAAIAVAIAMVLAGLLDATASAFGAILTRREVAEQSRMRRLFETEVVQRYCVLMFAALTVWGILAIWVTGRTKDAVIVGAVAAAMMFVIRLRSKPKKA